MKLILFSRLSNLETDGNIKKLRSKAQFEGSLNLYSGDRHVVKKRSKTSIRDIQNVGHYAAATAFRKPLK